MGSEILHVIYLNINWGLSRSPSAMVTPRNEVLAGIFVLDACRPSVVSAVDWPRTPLAVARKKK